MGPEDHTPEWDRQVEIITTVLRGKDASDIDDIIMLYAFDESFSRSAILEARHKILTAVKEDEQTTNT